MKEYSGYAQDTWRARGNLTLTFGMRLEKQGAFENLSGIYTNVGIAGLYGVSGVGHLFQPGTLTGRSRPSTRSPATPIRSRSSGRLR